MPRPTDIRLEGADLKFETFRYRTPMKFGGRVVTEITLANVTCEVTTREGRRARGAGSMPLANGWAFPSAVVASDQALSAMCALAERCAAICRGHTDFGHPIDLGVALEEKFLHAAAELSRELKLGEPIPKLATLVVGSAFDAAIHDAFGKAHGVNCYHTYGRDFLSHDLSAYLGAEYKGRWLDEFVGREPAPTLPMYHLVGALDALTEADVAQRVGDGLPETLPEWIAFNGLTHFKIKLNGDDLNWDLERVVAIDRIVNEAASGRRSGGPPLGVPATSPIRYSLDFNERCQSVGYLVEMLRKLRERTPEGFDRVQLVEQPTARDLRAHPENRMHEAAKLRPVVIDESLVDLETLLLAREMGYTGAALKACKGQSQSLLMAAACQHLGMFLCVQDLTCPGASLIQSASLAAHIPGMAGVESNSRQYVPVANRGWEDRFPGIFLPRDGNLATGTLTGPGLGATP